MAKQGIGDILKVELIHLDTKQNGCDSQTITEDMVKNKIKEIGKKLIKDSEHLINNIELSAIDDTSNDQRRHSSLKNYYEENVYRLSGSLRILSMSALTKSKKKQKLKEILHKVCQNDLLSNTYFGLIDQKPNIFRYLSPSEELKPRLEVPQLISFGLGTIVDMTKYVTHYSSLDNNSSAKGSKLTVAKDDIISDFQFDKKQLILYFRVKKFGGEKRSLNYRYRFEVEFKAISSAIVSVNKDSMKIFFTLSHPPILFTVAVDHMSHEEILKEKNERLARFRYRKRKFKVYKNPELDIGTHTYEIKSSEHWIRENEFHGCCKETMGKSTILMIDIPGIKDETKERRSNVVDPYQLLFLIKRFTKIPIHFANIQYCEGPNDNQIDQYIYKVSEPSSLVSQLRSKLKKNKESNSDSFRIEYAMDSVFSFNYKCSDELFIKNQFKEFIEKVIEFSELDPMATEESLFQLRKLSDRNAIFYTMNALRQSFKDIHERNEKCKKEKIDIKSFNTEIEYIRRCILTPTRIILLEAEPTLRSRFIKENDPDHTIRLSIREDDLQSLQFSIRNLNDTEMSFLHKIIKNPLKRGIEIGGRLFEFLGSSTSQLRDTGMILYAKDPKGRTAESIRKSIGDLSEIMNNVAKYVARIGLAFSQVMTHIDVPKEQTTVIADIEREKKKSDSGIGSDIGSEDSSDEDSTEGSKVYNFSDGIGKVSLGIMEKVYAKLKLDLDNRPSAMQIRYGGNKGMLVIDPTLSGNQIVFRKSMQKYKSNDEKLGIIKLSHPRALYLNRPLITILDQLGVNTKVFLKMLMDDLKNLADAMICECHASVLLQTHCSSSMGIPYRKLYDSGIAFLTEPLFRTMIDSVIVHRVKELKTKARIKVPMNCGRTVFGVLDETATLEYGEVFVQISEVDQNNRFCGLKILEGEIFVTKFPCLHPGDVRKLKAVDVEALHHHKDCIVFPQKGDRPHPNEMAGSDLDGDEYAVIWDSDNNASKLIFEGQNKKAMNFPDPPPKLLERDAQVDDILQFYCEYIVGNTVGLLASAHLANADREKDGIFSKVCMSLAKKYAVALDFAKTGKIENLDWRERPKMYPDFMEKFAQKRTYLSKGTLGQLYRHCDRYGSGIHTNSSKLKIIIEPNTQLVVKGWDREVGGKQIFVDWAQNIYNKYKMRIDYLLNHFGVDSEAILLSGAFSKTSKYMSGKSETNDVHELLENIVNKLFMEFKDYFNSESPSEKENPEERHQRASAWYQTPFSELNRANGNEPYYGFSWIITEELCNIVQSRKVIKSNASKDRHECQQIVIDLIDRYLHDKFIYREPNTDEYEDVSDKRQRIMEERWVAAGIVLRAWLERQDHLFFKRRFGRRVISSTDYQMSDMDNKLRREMTKRKVDLLAEVRDNTESPMKTAGQLIMDFLKDSLYSWMSIDHLDQNNRIVDTPMVKFGFSALITLNHFFKTREISHIISLEGRKFTIALKAPIHDETFYIPLPTLPNKRIKDDESEDEEVKKKKEERRKMLDKYVEYMVQKPELFCEQLKRLSGAIDIVLMPYRTPKRRLEHYYLMTVTGTVWSIQAIKNFVCHPSFFNTVANSDKQFQWKRKNLYCKDMPRPDTETNNAFNCLNVIGK